MDDNMMMYVCPGCKKIFKVRGNNKKVRCNTCENKYLVDLKKSMEEWASLDTSEKPKYINDAIRLSVAGVNTAAKPATVQRANQPQTQSQQAQRGQPQSPVTTQRVNKTQISPPAQKTGQPQSAVPKQNINRPSEQPQAPKTDQIQTQTKKNSAPKATPPTQIPKASQETKQESIQPQTPKIKQPQITNEDSSLFDVLDFDNGKKEKEESPKKQEPFDIFASLGVDKSDPVITRNSGAGINSVSNSTARCRNCGATIEEDQAFCPKCGAPKVATNSCSKCGAQLQNGQEFCPKCGQKVGASMDNNVSAAINRFNENIDRQNSKKKKIPIIIAASVVILVLLVIAGIKIAPKIFVSVEDLCAQGNYEKAYEKAKDDEKKKVYAESVIAELSAKTSNGLKDKASFELRDAWFDQSDKQVVLQIAGRNSFGGMVINYYYYTYDDDDKDFSLFCSVSDMDDDELYSWDDYEDAIEKALYNAAREKMRTIMGSSSNKLDKSGVKRINDLFSEDKLDDVEMIDPH